MERMTIRNSDGSVSQPTDLKWAEALDRLAAYEDTGLTPAEVSAIVKEWSDLCTIVGECGGIDRLRELAEADKDGRLVVHGRWIEDHDYLKCAECGVMVKWDFTFFDIGNWNYCPNCGAKMKEVE